MLIEFEFEGKRKELTEEQFLQFLEKNEYTLDVQGNICKNTGVLKLPLYGYQVIGTKFIDRAGGRCLIADAPGLGKTVQAIAYAQLHNLKVLIVCPLSVVVNWQREVKKFTGKPATIWDSKTYDGNLNHQFHITHYDAVAKNNHWLRDQQFDLLVCDEATYLKNRQTIRAKSILGSYKERRKFPGIKTKYVIFLTGTPVMSRPIEAFSLLNFLDKERFNNFFHFTQRYGGWKGAAPMNLQDLHDRTKDLVIRRKKDQVLKELPNKQRNDLYVELTKDEKAEYNKLLKEMFGKWKMDGRPSIQHMPKLQGFLIEKKLPRLIEMIDEFIDNDRSILIFSCYIKPLQTLLDHYKEKAGLLTGEMSRTARQTTIDRLIAGEAKVGLFSLRAAGMGIDGLQKAIDTVVFIDMDWTVASHEQGEDRTHRIGQKGQVQVYYMMCADTIDESMRDLLKEKQQMVDQIVDGEVGNITRNQSIFKDFIKKLKTDSSIEFEEIPD
jgi:SWI/SNF-related matrix-associated actin-dependent regulator 1 of chromatin subfamily A